MNVAPLFQAALMAFAAILVSSVCLLAARVVARGRSKALLLTEPAGQSETQVIPLVWDEVTIGREPTCTIQIPDPFVSSRHASIVRAGSGFLVRDLNSKNGTLVNGVRVREAKLSSGDVVDVGGRRFRLVIV